MGYILLADSVLCVHFVFMAIVVIGQLLILVGYLLGWRWVRNFWFRAIHLIMILIVVVEALIGVPCPLTTWETDLRALGGQPFEDISFTARLLRGIIFWEDKSWDDDNLAWSYYAFGALVLLSCLFVPPRLPRWKANPDESKRVLEPGAD